MPYIRLDEDGFEVDDDENLTYTGSFNYHSADEYAYKPNRFDPDELTGEVAAVYAKLRAIGLTRLRVRYDGGHDEGFAHADGGLMRDGIDRSIDAIVADLATPRFVDELWTAIGQPAADHRGRSASAYYAKLSPAEFVRQLLDELADEMAGCLLGDGYGTGEYSIYGAFTADLATGELTDDPSARRPPDGTFD